MKPKAFKRVRDGRSAESSTNVTSNWNSCRAQHDAEIIDALARGLARQDLALALELGSVPLRLRLLVRLRQAFTIPKSIVVTFEHGYGLHIFP